MNFDGHKLAHDHGKGVPSVLHHRLRTVVDQGPGRIGGHEHVMKATGTSRMSRLVPATLVIGALFSVGGAFVHQDRAAAANSHWSWCNANAVSSAPKIVWTRIKTATADHKDLPSSFYGTEATRNEIVKIMCYESTFQWHAEAAGQYGWFQMSQSLIGSEGVTFNDYWNGSSSDAAGYYQCVAGERYIHNRYGTPAVAWQHEYTYGWY
jgi:hypothetical protein